MNNRNWWQARCPECGEHLLLNQYPIPALDCWRCGYKEFLINDDQEPVSQGEPCQAITLKVNRAFEAQD